MAAMRRLDILRMNEFEELPAFEFSNGVSQRCFPLGIHPAEISFGVGNAKEVEAGVEVTIEFLSLCPQCLLRVFALGNITVDAAVAQ